MHKIKAVLYVRGLTPGDLVRLCEDARRRAQDLGFDIVAEYTDIGPAGFGRMSGFRKLKRDLARSEERVVVLVPRWSTLPCGPEHLDGLIERAEWRALEEGHVALDDIIREVVMWKREHHRERVRFAVFVARGLKAIGRPSARRESERTARDDGKHFCEEGERDGEGHRDGMSSAHLG
jgi:hypothetical protein